MKIFQDSEKGIQTAILQYLRYKGYYVQRMNSGAIRTEKGGLVRLNAPGTPDIMAFKPVTDVHGDPGDVALYFFEVKNQKGKVTFFQEEKMKELEQFGAKCYVVRSVEDVQQYV